MRERDSSKNWTSSNWHDLEDTYGVEVARAFRDGAVAYWRKYRPKMQHERADNPNTIPGAVVFGLCGLNIEANEVDKWPVNLTELEIETAIRYAFWEINEFPPWLIKIQNKFPEVFCNILFEEISCLILDKKSAHELEHQLLKLLKYLTIINIDGLTEYILNFFDYKLIENENILKNIISILVLHERVTDTVLSNLAQTQLADYQSVEINAIWYALLISVDPVTGIDLLKKQLHSLQIETDKLTLCMKVAVLLVGTWRRHRELQFRENYKTVQNLKELYYILHEIVKPEEDIQREGMYTPGLRDHTQDARNTIFNLLKEIPGKETYLALNEIRERSCNDRVRSWMKIHAHRRAKMDADLAKWKAEDIRDFSQDAEIAPRTPQELYSIAVSRLLDLKDDLENGDTSNAGLLIDKNEEEIRNFIGGWLRDRTNSKYTIAQEDELADQKRPDLRFFSNNFDAPIPCELKIADRWSGANLIERFENQLCNDYLRDRRSSFGIFLLIRNGKQSSWKHPILRKQLSFSDFCSTLQEYGEKFIAPRPDVEAVTVIGIDLTIRNIAKRENKSDKCLN